MEIYQEYFIKAIEHYSSITSQTHNQNVRNMTRVWLYLLTREHSPESTLLKQADNANPKDGWYRLARCPLSDWITANKKVEFLSQELPLIIAVRKNIYRLLSKHSEWTPSFSILEVL
jgi:hypothetical protein